LAEAVLFYHPAVWWVSNQIRVERELCCDDLAVAASGDVLTYARALAELESSRPAHRSTAMAATGGRLATRIGRLLGQPHGVNHTRLLNPPACSAGASAAWALGMVLLLGISAVAIRAHPAAASEQEPAVSRDAIWTDTA